MEKVYFGVDVTKKFLLGDKEQYIEHKKMNEGQKRQYESMTSQSIKMNQETKDITMDMRLGEDRKALIECTVIGYSILWGADCTLMTGKKINGAWDNTTQWEQIRDEMPSDIAMELFNDIVDLNNIGDKKK